MRKLSHLENTVLGIVWRDGPCTAYHVRKLLLESPSSHWSGSAGAIYPLMRRLEEAGLVGSRETGDRRGGAAYRVTADGRRQLRRWLEPPLPDEDADYSFHPVRTRFYFLDVLESDERLRLVEAALAQALEREAVVAADCEERRERGCPNDFLAARGVLHAVRARILWLREVRDALVGADPQ